MANYPIERYSSLGSDPFGKGRQFVQSLSDPNKLVTNVSGTAKQGLKRLYNSFALFGQEPTPDQVNQLKDYIQRNTASGAFGADFEPGMGIRSLIQRTRKSNLQQKANVGGPPLQQKANMGTQFGGGIMGGNFATGVGRGDMLPPKPRMNDEYGMRFSRYERNPETVKQRRLRQKEDLSGTF